MAKEILIIGSRKARIRKSITSADFKSKNILTDSVWEYVDLWLKRQGKKSQKALFFWSQAKNFYHASEILPVESRPLTSYYCCLNASKALLAMKGSDSIQFDNLSHGITSNMRNWESNSIKDAKAAFKGKGVLFELSQYFSGERIANEYTIYDLMYNIPCIHRAFSVTFRCTELFIPVKNVVYIVDKNLKKGWVQFQVEDRYANGKALRHISKKYEKEFNSTDNKYLMRRKKRFSWDVEDDEKARLASLSQYHRKIRKDLMYVYGNTSLWYVKKNIPSSNHILNQNSITLIYAVFHWLSELVRYNPEKFNALMNTKQNWLIHEFIDNALYQFIDELSCEITGHEIMARGYRN